MYPVALNLTKIPVLLAGKGALLERRVTMLQEAGATQLHVIENPTDADITKAVVVMVAGHPRDVAENIAHRAHALGKLVNVEDVNDLCDFYFTANVRRGDLVIAISTSGASPTLARKIRDHISKLFGEEWADRTERSKQKRAEFKAQGKSMREMMKASEEFIEKEGWLS